MTKPLRYGGFHGAVKAWRRELSDVWPILLVAEIEADALEKLRNRFKTAGKPAPSYNAIVIKSAALAIAELAPQYPELNAFIRRIPFFPSVHVFDRISCGCVASVDMDGQDRVANGVVMDPDKKSLSAITEELQAVIRPGSQAMKNIKFFYRAPYLLQLFLTWISRTSAKIRLENRGTFNITSVGKFGIDIQSVPQSASIELGFGVVRDRVVARDGQPLVVKAFQLSLQFDRMIMNGKPAALVLSRMKEIMEKASFPGEKFNGENLS